MRTAVTSVLSNSWVLKNITRTSEEHSPKTLEPQSSHLPLLHTYMHWKSGLTTTRPLCMLIYSKECFNPSKCQATKLETVLFHE